MSDYFKSTFSVLSTQVVVIPITLLSGIIIARFLGPEGKGILTIIVLIATTMKLFGGMGMEFANVYYASKKRQFLHNIIYNNIILWFFSILFLGSIYFLTKDFLHANIVQSIDQHLMIFPVIIFPLLLGFSYAQTLFQGLEKFKEYNILKFSESATKLIAATLFIIIAKMQIHGGIISICLSYFIPLLIAIILLEKIITQKISFNREFLFKSIKYGLKGQIGIFFQFFNYRLDLFLVSYYLNVKEVGFYAISVVMAEFLWYIPNSIAITLFPKVSSKDTPTANKFTCMISRYSIAIMLIILTIIWLGAPFIIRSLYGDQYISSVIPLRILLPGIVAFGLVKILTGHLHGRGAPQYGSIITICSLLVTIVFDLLLIPKAGIIGAALATTIAYFFSFILALVFFTKVTKLSLKEFLMPDFTSIVRIFHKIIEKQKDA